MVHRR